MKYVEGFAEGEVVYSREEAAACSQAQDESYNLPYIYLSAGVSAKLFKKLLNLLPNSGYKLPTVYFVDVQLGLDLFNLMVKKVKEAARRWFAYNRIPKH